MVLGILIFVFEISLSGFWHVFFYIRILGFRIYISGFRVMRI